MKEQHRQNQDVHEETCCCGRHHDEHEHREECCGCGEMVKKQGTISSPETSDNGDCEDDSGGDEEEGNHHRYVEEDGCCCCEEHDHDCEEGCSCGDYEHEHEEGCTCGDHEHNHEEGCSCCGGDGCGCGHDHGKADESALLVIILSIILLGVMYLMSATIIKMVFALAAVLVSGFEMFKHGLKNMIRLSFDEKALLTIAVVAAFIIGEYTEAAIVTILFKLGQYFEAKAITKSRGEIESLTKIRTDSANVVNLSGEIEKIDAREIEKGTVILIKAGEKIPLDCVVVDGNTYVDNSALTGESIAVEVGVGSKLLSGAINKGGVILCETVSLFEDSAASKIIKLVEQAAANKGETESFITKFAKIYTPIVIILAVCLAIIPPILTRQAFATWIYRSLVFLVTSCPCAFVISVPLSFYSGIGLCSRNGILVKGSKYIEKLAAADCVVMDKTGTVTSGKLKVLSIDLYTERDIGDLMAITESFSNHPTARAISHFFRQREIDTTRASEVHEIAGRGIELKIDGIQYYCGSRFLMEEKGISVFGAEGANVYFANDHELLSATKMIDTPREEAYDAVRALRREGVRNITLLTGDGAVAAEYVKNEIGADKVECDLLPEDKVDLMSQIKSRHTSSIYVGDGINDAPVIAISDCGIAMGMGSEAAINTADAVLVKDNLMGITKAIQISKVTMKIAKQNIILALGIKIFVLLFGALGFVPMWAAVIADVGVMVMAVLNSTRMLVSKNNMIKSGSIPLSVNYN